MNKRIKELAAQAVIRVNNPIVNSDGVVVCDDWEQSVSLEKFAELIVKECANIANAGIDPTESHLIGDDILHHFGVK